MDLLFKRYASPFPLIDGMILAGRFSEFVDDFIRTINKETEAQNKDKEMRFHWEFWLYRVLDKTFPEYMREIENDKKHRNISERELGTTLQHTSDILNSFNPENGGD
jgi:DNA polymerase III sliding clamp (beta) subunit (PCNA family)